MKTSEEYINGLKRSYFAHNLKGEWEHFENIKHGVEKNDVIKLKAEFPMIPDSLINLLEFVDGTYWREYKGEEIVLLFLGSEGISYYLLSAKQMLESKIIDAYFSDHILDEKIIDNVSNLKWLHFSDCSNNGGSSKLFIDFSPSSKGIVGQIVRFLHDPDEYTVIANNFDEYLQMEIDGGYSFIEE